MIYGPGEDSFLMMKQIKDYAKGLVLDMGTGSGIQAEEANKYADEVLAVDVNPEAINYCKKKYKKIKNIE
ncbi:MAG: methyltransferase domain-containing protein, partial [Nanoarchaeota archaeon]|nr:methyltransferase domain-containing protein [Nanoarchaeota archaeon]